LSYAIFNLQWRQFSVCSSFGLTLLDYSAAAAVVTTVPICFSHKSIAASVYENEHCPALKCCYERHPIALTWRSRRGASGSTRSGAQALGAH